jgi:long-chain acyl-CoA synthetase
MPRYTTLIQVLREAARAFPDREALVCGARRASYREYLDRVAAVAAHLSQLGVRGERVAILLPNSIEVCIAFFGAHAAGAIVVPLNPLYTERELADILADAAPTVVLFDATRRDEISRIAAKLNIGHLEPIDLAAGNWADVLKPSDRRSDLEPAAGDLAFIQYTGGTTSRSKGVMLTHHAICANIDQREALLPTLNGSAQGERILCPMPIFHAYGLTMGLYLSAYCAGTLVIMPRYRAGELLALIDRERVTIFPGSPTIFTGLMSDPHFAATDWRRVHTCYSGSAALSEETLRRWEAATGAPIYEGYGQTEAGPILTYNAVHGPRKPGTVGVAVADTELEIVDLDTGTRRLAIGEPGEIRARGPQLMQGYWHRPDETALALRDGWLHTGDIGSLDAEGFLTIRDRKKDMVIVGGYNVYPREVDEVLFMHPSIVDAATVGIPDPYRGERLCAFVVARGEARVTTDELIAHCAKNLARYKVPAVITMVAALPKTTVGKTDKRALREQAIKL